VSLTVWLVAVGECKEGSEVIDAFTNEEAAVQCALAQRAYGIDGKWHKSLIPDVGIVHEWISGNDVMTVRSFEVKETFTPHKPPHVPTAEDLAKARDQLKELISKVPVSSDYLRFARGGLREVYFLLTGEPFKP
jgi:hypothetical protein